MGCVQSREVTLRKADLATADGGMKAVECVVGMPLAARTGYVLKRRRRFLGGYFEIKDHTDTVVFKWMPANNWFALHGQMMLQDDKGNNLCVLEKKILSMRSSAPQRSGSTNTSLRSRGRRATSRTNQARPCTASP